MAPNWEQTLTQRSNGEIEGFLGREDDVVEHDASEAVKAAVAGQNQTAAAVDVNDVVAQVLAALAAQQPELQPEPAADVPSEFSD